MESEKLVSIIVPAYNVEHYIDRCINSIVNQSYQNIEVVIIDDGSIDHTLERCSKWAERDNRIKFFHNANNGLSFTRNYGVVVSRGEYISFVDADDWIKEDYIRLMIEKAQKERADMVICDYVKSVVDGERYVNCYVPFGQDYKNRVLLHSNSAVWNKMFNRAYWIENAIEFPEGYDEDTAIFPIIVLCAEHIACINDGLYMYEKKRTDSITNNAEKRLTYADTLQRGIDWIKQNNMWGENEKILWRYYLKWTCNALAPCIGNADYDLYNQVRNKFVTLLEKNFDKQIKKTCVWGSYNLSKIVRETIIWAEPWLRFQYITVEETVSDLPCELDKREQEDKSKNLYREFMRKRVREKSVWKVIEKERPDYFILDLVEERNQIQTLLSHMDRKEMQDIEIECWKKTCKEFVKKLKKYFSEEHVVLVENYLSENYLLDGAIYKFENFQEIRKANDILKEYYSYFKSICPRIYTIDGSDNEKYYTDAKYEYGCYPWHLNDEINYIIANQINEYVGEY